MTANGAASPSKVKLLGRKALQEIATIVTPDTILRWHRELVAQKWNYSACRQKAGRPPVSQEIIDLLLRMARENPTYVKRADMWSWVAVATAMLEVRGLSTVKAKDYFT